MRAMSGRDAMMLAMETPRAYMHTLKVSIVDPAAAPDGWSFDRYRDTMAHRLHLLPLLRWRYLPAPLGLGHPFWAEDPEFDLNNHLRRVACPAPGDRRALCSFIASVYTYPLDRSRPLWLTWVVEGLEEGRVALVTLVHHAYVDGAGAANGLLALHDPDFSEESPCPEVPWHPPPLPSWGRRLTAGAVRLPLILARGVPGVVRGMRAARRWRVEAAGSEGLPDPRRMPATPLNRTLGRSRSLALDSIPLALFQAARGLAPGITVNDVFLACCSGALRRQLQAMAYDPDLGPLVAAVPMAAARPAGEELHGNHTTVDYTWLPVHLADPGDRLRACHQNALAMKAHYRAIAGADLSALVQLSPPGLIRLGDWFIRRSGGRFSTCGNVTLSNVRGPDRPLFLGPYRVEQWFSIGQVFEGTPLNITLWSYCDSANLCVLADPQVVPDPWLLCSYVRDELASLVALATASKQA